MNCWLSRCPSHALRTHSNAHSRARGRAKSVVQWDNTVANKGTPLALALELACVCVSGGSHIPFVVDGGGGGGGGDG